MGTHKDLIRELEANGHHVVISKSTHIKVLRSNGSYAMTMSTSPSDKHATNKARQLARRLGLLAEPC